jgi:hypothetical protein
MYRAALTKKDEKITPVVYATLHLCSRDIWHTLLLLTLRTASMSDRS